jgi:hypothetical protein
VRLQQRLDGRWSTDNKVEKGIGRVLPSPVLSAGIEYDATRNFYLQSLGSLLGIGCLAGDAEEDGTYLEGVDVALHGKPL